MYILVGFIEWKINENRNASVKAPTMNKMYLHIPSIVSSQKIIIKKQKNDENGKLLASVLPFIQFRMTNHSHFYAI